MPAFYTPTFGPNGFVAPSAASVLSGVQAAIDSAFGGGLNPGLSTPQGQLATTLTAVIDDKNSTFLFYSNQTDPQYAQGRMQDAIGQIYFMSRIPAQSTQVLCTCTGLTGTPITVNAQAQDTSGNIYVCLGGGTIPASGSIDLLFKNIATGPIPCLAGTLTRIYSSISGWSGITNAGGTDTDPTTLGRSVENQQEFEYRRQQSVALNSVGMVQSIYAAVAASASPNPSDVFVTDNTSKVPATIGGVVLAPNSVYVAVVGGNPSAIAAAVWSKKMPGCSYAQDTAFTASIATNVLTVTAVSCGVLAVGQTVTGVGIPYGTTIASLGTGTGGTGTYNLSTTPGTIGSESMTSRSGTVVYDYNYTPPVPYIVSWTVPTNLPVYFTVNIVNSGSLPADIVTLIKNAVVSAFAGGDGGPAARIGGEVFASRFYVPIIDLSPFMQIISIFVGTTAAPSSGNSVPVNIDQFPITLTTNITVNLV